MATVEAKPGSLRFSLRTLLIAMAVIGLMIPLAGYTLRHASTWVGSHVFFAVSMLHTTTLCMAFNRAGAARAWWTGCAIFGFAYYMIGGDPWSQPYNYELFTETISTAGYNAMFPEGQSQPTPDALPPPPTDPLAGSRYSEPPTGAAAPQPGPEPPDVRDFVMVAHMYWSLLLAFLGGWVSLAMYWTGRRSPPAPTSGGPAPS
jgi:hypothetical protein